MCVLCRGGEALIVKNDSHYFPLTIKLRGNPSFSEVRTNKNDQTHTCTASMQENTISMQENVMLHMNSSNPVLVSSDISCLFCLSVSKCVF